MSLLSSLVAGQRHAGVSWPAIGALMGVQGEAARRRFANIGRGDVIEAAILGYEEEARDLVGLLIEDAPHPKAALAAYAVVFAARLAAMTGEDQSALSAPAEPLQPKPRAKPRMRPTVQLSPSPPLLAVTNEPAMQWPLGVIATITQRVATETGLSVEALRGPDRRRKFAWPRQRVMAEAWATGEVSLPQIGRYLGDRDHTTVLHGIRRHLARASIAAGRFIA